MRSLLFTLFLLGAVPILFAPANGTWLARVPSRERTAPNPYADDQNAVAAGTILFARNCASCHGKAALGDSRHPNLHTQRVLNATDGELYWLLSNGDLKRGMPSWSRLPEAQRWQTIRYLHSLPVEEGKP